MLLEVRKVGWGTSSGSVSLRDAISLSSPRAEPTYWCMQSTGAGSDGSGQDRCCSPCKVGWL